MHKKRNRRLRKFPKALLVEEVLQATQNDAMLQNVKDCISINNMYKLNDCEEMAAYERLVSELSVQRTNLEGTSDCNSYD